MGIYILQLAETINKDNSNDGYQKCQQVNTDNLSVILQFTFHDFLLYFLLYKFLLHLHFDLCLLEHLEWEALKVCFDFYLNFLSLLLLMMELVAFVFEADFVEGHCSLISQCFD